MPAWLIQKTESRCSLFGAVSHALPCQCDGMKWEGCEHFRSSYWAENVALDGTFLVKNPHKITPNQIYILSGRSRSKNQCKHPGAREHAAISIFFFSFPPTQDDAGTRCITHMGALVLKEFCVCSWVYKHVFWGNLCVWVCALACAGSSCGETALSWTHTPHWKSVGKTTSCGHLRSMTLKKETLTKPKRHCPSPQRAVNTVVARPWLWHTGKEGWMGPLENLRCDGKEKEGTPQPCNSFNSATSLICIFDLTCPKLASLSMYKKDTRKGVWMQPLVDSSDINFPFWHKAQPMKSSCLPELCLFNSADY